MALDFTGIVQGAPSPLKGNTRFTSAIQLWVRQRDAVIRDDWDAVEDIANQGLGTAYGAYRVLMRTLGVFDALGRAERENLAAFLTFHAGQQVTRQEFFAESKKQLVKLRPDLSAARRAALDELGEGDLSNNLILKELRADRDLEDPDVDGRAIDSTVALFNRSIVALFYASYNKYIGELSSHPFEHYGDRLVETYDELVNRFERDLDDDAKRLHKELNGGKVVQRAAEQLAAQIEDTLPAFGRMQASLHLYLAGLRKDGAAAGLLASVGRLAVKASALSRSAFALHSAAYYLCLQSRVVKKDPKAKKMLDGDGRPYDAAFPNGRDTKLSDVENVADDSYLELQGFVSALTARRAADNKLLSVVTMTDASGMAKVDAIGVFVHLRNVGLHEGAYCQVSGNWKKSSSIHSGKPALEIQQLPIDQLAEKSWKVQLHDLSDRFVDWWPGGLNVAFAVSPHVSGGPDGASNQLGAGELIFRQFYRD